MLLVAALIAVALYVVGKLSLVFLSLFAAVLLTAVVRPIAAWLERHRWPRSLAAGTATLTLVLAIAGAFTWIIPRSIKELSATKHQLASRAQALARSAIHAIPGAQLSVPQLLHRAGQWGRSHTSVLLSGAATGASAATEIITAVFLVIVLVFFLVRDGERLVDGALAPLTPVRRRLARRGLNEGWNTLTRWVQGTSVVALIDALCIGAGIFLLKVPLVLPLTLLTFIAAYVPIVGAVVAGAVAVAVAWAAQGTQAALIILAVVFVVNQLEGNVLQPLIMGRVLPLHPVVIMLAVTTGILVAGIAGALVAIPLTSAVVAGVRAFRDEGRAVTAERARREDRGVQLRRALGPRWRDEERPREQT